MALENAAKSGDFVELRLPMRKIYFINHPDYIKHVLVDHHRRYIKGRGLQATRPLIGNGLLTSEGEFHMRQRRMIQPSFHRRRVASYAETITQYTQDLLDSWDHLQTCDLHQEMMHLTMRIVARCLFDVDVHREASELGAALEGVFANFSLIDVSPLGILLSKLPLPRYRRRLHYGAMLDKAIYGYINERRAQSDLSSRSDLLSMLIESLDVEGNGEGMTDTQVRDEVMTLFLAGHETTANALSWTFYLLMQHPEVAAKLVDEVQATLHERPPTMDDLASLPYTHNVFAEAMRLYPPAWVIGRTAVENDLIDGYHVPVGSTVLMSQWVMHRDMRYWDDPDDFRPERFESENERPRYAYFPFGGGPRLCIGESFAWMEGQLLLASIMQRFDFQLAPEANVEPEPLITLRLKHGLPVTIFQR